MINVSDLLRGIADTLEQSQNNLSKQREASGREVDPQAISDALVTLGATGISVARELFDSIPEQFKKRERGESSIFSAAEVEDVINKIVARLGLVEESDVAGLRKRIADLEAKLNS